MHIKSGGDDCWSQSLVVPGSVLKQVGSSIISVSLHLGVSSNKMLSLLLECGELVSILPGLGDKVVGEEAIKEDGAV